MPSLRAGRTVGWVPWMAGRGVDDVRIVGDVGVAGSGGRAAAAGADAPVPGFAGRVTAVQGSPVRDIRAVTSRPEVVNFAGGLPAPELFDTEAMAAAYRDVLAESAGRALQYATTEGEPVLREALAARYRVRGLPTGADDVLVTTGSQQVLSLLATALVDPGDVVLVEDPCYLAALQER